MGPDDDDTFGSADALWLKRSARTMPTLNYSRDSSKRALVSTHFDSPLTFRDPMFCIDLRNARSHIHDDLYRSLSRLCLYRVSIRMAFISIWPLSHLRANEQDRAEATGVHAFV